MIIQYLIRFVKTLLQTTDNVMHSTVVFTDQIYGRLAADDIKSGITNLKSGQNSEFGIDQKLDEILQKIQVT